MSGWVSPGSTLATRLMDVSRYTGAFVGAEVEARSPELRMLHVGVRSGL